MNELLTQIIYVLYNLTRREYLSLLVLSISFPLFIFILTFILPKKFNIKDVILSFFTLIPSVIYTFCLILVLIVFNQNYTVEISFTYIYLLINVWITFIFGIFSNKMGKYLIFSFSLLLLNLPLIYTGFFSRYTLIPFLITYVFTILILSLRLKKYYAKH